MERPGARSTSSAARCARRGSSPRPALYALDHHVERLADDHARARRLAEGWHAAGLPVDLDRVETNFVQLDVAPLGLAAARSLAALREAGVGLSTTIHPPASLRAVTHLDVERRGHRPGDRARPGRRSAARVRPESLAPSSSPARDGAGRAAAAVASPRRLPRRRDHLASARSGSPTSARARGDAATRLPHRLDHEDVHGRAASCSSSTQARSSSTTPLAHVRPRGARRRRRSGWRSPHCRGLQREPPGEIWETLTPPSRDELLAGLEDAEQVLAPGEQWHYSNLAYALLGEIVARVTGEHVPRRPPERSSIRSACADEPASRRRRGARYFVDPYSDVAHAEPDLGSDGVDRGARAAVVDGRRSRALGHLPRRRARRRPAAGDARPDGARADHGRPGRAGRSAGGSGLELYRRGDRVFAGHGGAMPGFLAGLVVHRARADRRGGADEHATGARRRKPRARPRRRRARRTPARRRSRGSPAAPSRPSSRRSSGSGGPRATRSSSRSATAASRRSSSTGRRAGTSRVRAGRRGPVPCRRGARAGRAAARRARRAGQSSKLYFATYPMTREPSTFA